MHATPAYEPPPGTFVEGGVGASSSTEFFTTTANYEKSRGEYTSLPTNNNLTFLESKLRARYTATSRFSLFAGTTYASTRATDPLRTKTNARMSEFIGGVDWLVNVPYVQLTLEVLGSSPLDMSDPAQVVPMTNDGVFYFRPGVFVQKALRRFRLGGYAGVHAPAGGLATRFIYEATVDTRLFWWFTLGGGVNGYETMLTDTSTLVNRQSTAGVSNVGSERFYSYNPALIEGRAWVGIRPNKAFWLRFGYAQTINGLHNAAGSSYLLSLVYNSSTPPFSESPDYYAPESRRRPSPDNVLRSFEPDVEPSDMSVFDQDYEESMKGKTPLDKTERMLEKRSQDK